MKKHRLYTQLKLLSLLLFVIFIIALGQQTQVVARAFKSNGSGTIFITTINNILRGNTSRTLPIKQSTQVSAVGASLWTSIRSIMGTSTATPESTSPSRDTGTITARSASTPALVCVPQNTNGSEQTIIMWACRNGETTATGDNFQTNGAPLGSVRVQATTTTTYTVACGAVPTKQSTHTASCTVQVVKPVLLLKANLSPLQTAMRTVLSWDAQNVRSCVLTQKGNPQFIKKGVTGRVTSPLLYHDSLFTLSCDTVSGLRVQTTTKVVVQ